ncbi:MAG: hypothetical protein ABSA13_08910 [Beijerinckiaceae bacterium]|jgi:hypothetical protein
MKNDKIIDGRPAVSMPVSHRIDAPAFGRRPGHEQGASSRPAARALNSSTVLVAAAVAFAIPATMFGLFSDGSSLSAPEPPAAIGLRGSLPVIAQEN